MSDAPRLIVVAGPNGAGKTSITEQLLRHEWMGGCEYVNPVPLRNALFQYFGQWLVLPENRILIAATLSGVGLVVKGVMLWCLWVIIWP